MLKSINISRIRTNAPKNNSENIWELILRISALKSIFLRHENICFQVLTLPYRDVYEFGGGIHCTTWDSNRDDTQVDLFPKWVPKSFYRQGEDD